MQLESARAELRVRGPSEAMDLGLLLLRALRGPALRAWLAVVLPLQLLLAGPFALSGHLVLALLVLWWAKPLVDRVWVQLLGEGLFGPAPGPRALWGKLWRRGHRGLLGDLLWRRPDAPRRPLFVPVGLLEGLGGEAAVQRRRVLSAAHSGAVWTLWTGGVLIEASVLSGVLALFWWLLPDEAHWTPGMILGVDRDVFGMRALLGTYLLASGLGEASFVAAGFGLYINGRTQIEGWDVELVFRRMARRLSRGAPGTAALALVAILGAPFGARAQPVQAPRDPTSSPAEDDGLAPPADPSAATTTVQSRSALRPENRLPPPALTGEEEAARALRRVWERPELKRERFEERWVLRDFGDEQSQAEPRQMPAWLVAWVQLVATGLEVLLWALFVLVAAGLAYLAIVQLRRGETQRSGGRDGPAPSGAVEVAASERPLRAERALFEARSLALAGRHDEALGVLYAGMLTALRTVDGLAVPVGATEQECLRLASRRGVDEARQRVLRELVQQRVRVSYGHGDIDAAQLEALCTRCAAAFGVPA